MKKFNILVLCNVSMVCISISTNIAPVFLTILAATFGSDDPLTQEQLGRIGASIFAGFVLGLVISAFIASKIGAKALLASGNLILAIGILLFALAPDYSSLLLFGICLGSGAGILEIITSPVVSALADNRTSALNRLHAFYSIGSFCTIIICSVAIYAGLSWRLVTAFLAILPALAFVASLFITSPPMHINSLGRELACLSRERFFQLSVLGIVLAGCTELGIMSWLPAFSERVLNFPAWFAGFSLLGFYVGMAAGRIWTSKLAFKLDPADILIAFSSFACLLVLAAAFITNSYAALISGMAVGLGVSCLWPTTLALVAAQYPSGGPVMFGILAIFGNIGGILMPWIIGLTADHSNLRVGLSTDALAAILLILLILVLKTLRRPRPL